MTPVWPLQLVLPDCQWHKSYFLKGVWAGKEGYQERREKRRQGLRDHKGTFKNKVEGTTSCQPGWGDFMMVEKGRLFSTIRLGKATGGGGETGRKHAEVSKALGTFKRLSRETRCRKGRIIAHKSPAIANLGSQQPRAGGGDVHSN